MAASGANGDNPEHSRRVAVIGGGPGGVASCRFLKEMGHTPVVFEMGKEVGGIWAPEPTNPVIYQGLRTNIPKFCMQSPDMDYPEDLPSFIAVKDFGKYIRSYCDGFDLRKYIRFKSRVTSVKPLCTEEEETAGQAAWSVTWQEQPGDDADQQEASDTFDAVVVANGHYLVPYMPELPGQAEWLAGSEGNRSIIHAHSYDHPQEFTGRVVLVVGGRSSGVDIARELRQEAKFVYVLDKAAPKLYRDGNCVHVPRGARLQEDGSLSLGGEVVPGEPIEVVMLATGYEYSFPFLNLEEVGLELGPTRRSVMPLFQHVMHARRPSLNFLGIPLALPTPFLVFEAQARYIAAQLRRLSVSTDDREKWVAEAVEATAAQPQALHLLGQDVSPYLLELAALSGTAGEELEAYRRSVKLIMDVSLDRKARQPTVPWGDDSYRRCEYSVDWEAGSWSVVEPSASN